MLPRSSVPRFILFQPMINALVTALIIATLQLSAQVAPPQQGYPAQAGGFPGQSGAPAGDQGPAGPGAGVARISLLDGDVSVRRGDSGDYVAAALNAPAMLQDSIQTGANARAEVQFDAVSMVRLAQNTELHFTDLQNGRAQMELGRGTITFRILRNTNAQVEIDTPSISIRPAQMGVYRVTVTDDGQTYVTPRNGQVEVFTPKGSQIVPFGQTLMARGTSSDPEYQIIQALNRDEWDAWSDSRDKSLQQAWAAGSRYVPPSVYGTEDLAGNGQWVNTPEYGYAWTPNAGPDWSPYSDGRWVWEDYYGWTWVGYEPWGWAPYHYGRWFNRPGFGWCWWPGAINTPHYWSPALVGFFGFGGLGFGSIGWVPLAPFERFYPWYGRGGFNNTAFIHNTNVASVYRNARIGNGVMGMSAQQFGRTSTGYSRVSATDLRSASLMRGGLPVSPSSQSMRFSDRQTNTVARTDFSQTRFATHMTPSSVQRGSFSRSSASGSSGESAIPGTRAFGSTPGTRSVPQTSSQSGGWNRFGSSSGTSSGSAYSGYRGPAYGSTGGRSQLQISPPLVRERGNYSTPSSSASRPAPSYSAPAQRSAPGGGGHPSVGGGHSSGGHR